MSVVVLLALLAFFGAPFAISGFRRSWRGAVFILVALALYTGYAWMRPLQTDIPESDWIGAAGWSMTLLVLLIALAMSFASGLVLSFLRDHRPE